jgi:hypothetical protein
LSVTVLVAPHWLAPAQKVLSVFGAQHWPAVHLAASAQHSVSVGIPPGGQPPAQLSPTQLTPLRLTPQLSKPLELAPL